jgi:hypothetical protein
MAKAEFRVDEGLGEVVIAEGDAFSGGANVEIFLDRDEKAANAASSTGGCPPPSSRRRSWQARTFSGAHAP